MPRETLPLHLLSCPGLIISPQLFEAITTEFFQTGFGQYNSHHGFANHPCSGNYTNIAALIAALVYILPACQVDRGQGMSQGRNRFDANVYYQWFTIANTSLDATSVIG